MKQLITILLILISLTSFGQGGTKFTIKGSGSNVGDSVKKNTDTLIVHNTRIGKNNDSLISHNTRIGANTTNIATNITNIQKNTDSNTVHNTRLNQRVYVTPEQYGAVKDGSTDDATAIQNAVNSGKPVWFSQGNYKVGSTIQVPQNAVLVGAGDSSIISITANDTILNINGNNIEISSLTLKGSSSGAGQTGIAVVGNVGLTLYRSSIQIINCTLLNFGFAGWYNINVVGQYHDGGSYLVNTIARGCVNGFFADTRAEYNSFVNCFAFNNTTGFKNNGGNNNWTGGAITDNTTGVVIGSGTNDGHATMSNVKVNHNTTALSCVSTANGYLFEACNFATGNISIVSCSEMKFVACDLNTIGTLTVTTSPLTQFIECRIITNPTISVTTNQPLFRNCYWSAGVPLTVSTESIGQTDGSPLVDLTAATGASTNPAIRFNDGDISGVPIYSGFTPAITTNTVSLIAPADGSTNGGMQYWGFTKASGSAGSAPLYINGVHGNTSPTIAAVRIRGFKSNGTTGLASLASTEKVFELVNNSTGLTLTLGSGYTGFGGTTPTSMVHTTSFATGYRAITALRTLDDTDHTIECTSGTFTVTLPTAVGITGREYWITNTGSGTITIGTTSSQTFINVTATPTTLSVAQFSNYKVKSNGANWLAYKIVN